MSTHAVMVVVVVLSVATLTCSAVHGDRDSQSAGSAAPDYATLHLQGNGMAQDSVSLSVVAAAQLLGRDAEYLPVYCRSTNAFTPAIDPGEDCPSWWHVASALGTRAMRPLARSLGLSARDLRIPVCESMDPEVLEAHGKDVAAAVRRAMLAGSVVIITGQWNTDGPHGFVPWGWAGIITEADPGGGTLRGACLNGHRDNRVLFVSGAWALSKVSAPTPPLEADLEMLRRAVARVKGETPFRPSTHAVFGLQAMDLWIEQMSGVPGFCGGCRESSGRGWTDARDNAVTMDAGAAAVATYLRQRAPKFPAAARPCLEATAKHYGRVQELLRPALTGEGGESFEQFVGNMEKQRAYARQVLTPIRAELAAAAESMEEALAAVEAVPE